MTTGEPLSPGEQELAAYERDPDFRRIHYAANLAPAIAELRASETVLSGIVLLGKWAIDYPFMTTCLLERIAKDPAVSLELAPVILGYLPSLDGKDSVLAAAFPGLTGAYRDAAADRPGVRKILKMPEGVGYESVPKPDPSWLWPKGKPFPSIETIEGVQARLNYLGYGAGPVNGEWSDLTRRAFMRWQVHDAVKPDGERDYESLDDLARQAGDAPDR